MKYNYNYKESLNNVEIYVNNWSGNYYKISNILFVNQWIY